MIRCDPEFLFYRNFQKKCQSKRHLCDMQFADVACALKTQTAIIHMILYKVYRVCVLLSIYNLMPNVKSAAFILSE